MLQNVVAMQHFAVIFPLSEQSAQATSKQMNQITTRLMAYGEFEVFTFGDECLLNQPVEEWPVCDYLLSWFSDGFPLDKAQAYIALRKVPTMNDLNMQVSRQNPNAMRAMQRAPSGAMGLPPSQSCLPSSSLSFSSRTAGTCTAPW